MPEKTEPFTWIVKGKIAVSWWPDQFLFKSYKEEGVSVIINCSEFDNLNDIPKEFKYYHINVPDYGIPSNEQINRFLQICKSHHQKEEAIAAHCVGGCGRSAQFLIAWAAYNGYILKDMDPVKWIRNLRPCSLETKEQMINARKLARIYQKNH